MLLTYNKKKLTRLCKKNHIKYLGLFGSHARQEAKHSSDIDLLVEFSQTPSLLRHVGIEYEMSETLFSNKKVDLITKRSLNKHVASHVYKDLVTLYETPER